MEEKIINNKKKIFIVTTVTIALLVLIVGVSYALWQQVKVQEDTNVIASGCFGVHFEGNNPIDLANSFPITTEDGMKTIPYTFTITNTCNGKAAYNVNLEALESTTIQNTSVRVALDDTNKLYSEYDMAEKYYDTSIESRKLTSGRLEAGESVTYNLRLWIDEAVTIEEQNKTFASKIVVNANEDFDDPEITDLNATSTINSINITYNANGDISNTCKWGIEEGTYDNIVEGATNTNCDITGLTDDTTYYYQICTETGKGTKCETGNITTLIDSPEPSITNLSATSTYNSITITYNANGDVGTTCKYGTSTSYGSSASSVTNSRCSITGLSDNTTYYYQICTETRKGNICKDGNISTILPISSQVKLGDYISMTPSRPSFVVTSSKTGCSTDGCAKDLNLEELNLWRVIKENDDGTIDMISVYVSSVGVTFGGKVGYLGYVGTLNEFAYQYTDSVHVKSGRHLGYSNQVEQCTKLSLEECPGDGGYISDTSAVEEVFGTLNATKPDGKEPLNGTWLASRYTNSSSMYYGGRYIDSTGKIKMSVPLTYLDGGANSTQPSRSIRPILTLKSSTEITSGKGTSNDPYKLT